MASNYCKYCNKYFHYKDLFDQHVVTCEFFYRSRRQKDRDLDSIETLPSPQEQFKLIQHLLLKVKSLENDVIRLKSSSGIRQRKQILNILNNPDRPDYSKPSLLFEQWYKTIHVQQNHLQSVFDGDICDGFIKTLKGYLTFPNIPICSFKQKPNTIYIYTDFEDTPKWIVLTNDMFDKWIRHLNHCFLKTFLQWQLNNEELIRSSDQQRDINNSYVHKINGLNKTYEQKRQYQLKKWIYDSIAKDISINEHLYI